MSQPSETWIVILEHPKLVSMEWAIDSCWSTKEKADLRTAERNAEDTGAKWITSGPWKILTHGPIV